MMELEALHSLAQSDPASLDIALLAPLQKQLTELQDEHGDEIPDEVKPQIDALALAVETLVDEQRTRLDKMASDIEKDWQKAVTAKRPIEDRWVDDERRFMGDTGARDSKLFPNDSADPARSESGPVSSRATRTRVLQCWGRLADMLLPANDFPIRVDAPDSPDPKEYPSLGQALQAAQQAQGPQDPNQPQQVEPIDPKAVLSRLADDQASKMQDRVFSMLRRANFQAEARKALLDTARIGTGLLKGPFPCMKQKRKMQQGGQISIEETPEATVSWVDPWKWWYDMTPTLKKSSATYEVQILSRREMEDFKRYPRVISTAIDELLLDQEPKLRGNFRDSVKRRNDGTGMSEPLDDVWAVLETHKILSPETLKEVMGIEWDSPDLPLIHFWSCDGKCIKFKLTPLEHDYRPDYYNMTIMPADDTIFGYGYSYMCQPGARFLSGALNATMVNAAAAATPFVFVAQGKVHPNREKWKIPGLTVFSIENPEGSLDQYFSTESIQSNVDDNLKMMDVAQKMLDDDTLFSEILQGGANGEEMPASGMVMRANISNVFQKSIAAYADDNCFQPLGERMVWWAQMYDEQPIDGDHEVKAIAATQLVSKDLTLQHTQVAIGMSQNPQFAGFSDPYELYKSFLMNIDGLQNRDAIIFPKDIAMKNQAAIQAQQSQGDPSKAAEIASREKIEQAKIESAEEIAKFRMDGEVQMETMRQNIARMGLQLGMVQLSQKTGIDLKAIQADLEKAQMADNTDRSNAAMEQTVKANLEIKKLTAPVGERPYSSKD